jgi:hypothetical protein
MNTPADHKNSFHCLYCQGYEDSVCESVDVVAGHGITADASPAAHVAQLANEVIVYTNGSETLAQEVVDREEEPQDQHRYSADQGLAEGF